MVARLTGLSWHSRLHRDSPGGAREANLAGRSAWRLLAVILLLIAALGSLAIAASALAAGFGPAGPSLPIGGLVVVGAVAGAYGLGSLIAAVGVWRRRSWALAIVLASQGLLALDIASILLRGIRDASLVAVLSIAVGAIAFTVVADRRDGVTWTNPAAGSRIRKRDVLVPAAAGLAIGAVLLVALFGFSGALTGLVSPPMALLFDTWLIAPVVVATGWALACSGRDLRVARALLWVGLVWLGIVACYTLVVIATCALCLA